MQEKNIKYDTENYVIEKGVDSWKDHANANIMNVYKKHIYGDVLDVGCNTGGSTYWLSLNDTITSITGVDINPNVENIFRTHMADLKIKTDFISCDYTQNTIIDREFDTVLSFHTLEHICEEYAPKFISNILKNLKKSGKFIISIPYKDAYVDDHHRGFYEESSLKNLLECAGFNTIECFLDNRWRDKHLLTGIFEKI